MRSLAAQGYAPLTRVRALERTAAQLDGEQGSLHAQIAGSREAVGETRLQISGVSTKMNEDIADQLREIDVQLNNLTPRLTDLRAQIARSEVRAPVSVFAFRGPTPNSGSAIHSRRPSTSRGMPTCFHGSPSSRAT